MRRVPYDGKKKRGEKYEHDEEMAGGKPLLKKRGKCSVSNGKRGGAGYGTGKRRSGKYAGKKGRGSKKKNMPKREKASLIF